MVPALAVRHTFCGVTAVPFDPTSPGARRLARDWVPELERWEMRVPDGHVFIEGNGSVIQAGETNGVGAPIGRQLVERGYELVGVHRMRRGD
jgi:hypothetical protein